MARAARASFERMQGRMPLGQMAEALRLGDAREADRLVSELGVEDALRPVANIVEDTVLVGGKVGGKEV